jgi:PKD repeat protein
VWLEQLSTGEKFSILGDTAKFNIPANLGFATDFVLHAGPANYLIAAEESCYNTADASVLFKTPNFTGAAFELNDANGIIAAGTMSANDTTIYNLSAGNYVAIIRINNITLDSTDITINPKNPIIADFSADYNSILVGQTVTFTDNSTGAVSYAWNFGDGNSDSTAGTVAHTYNAVDYFTVSLTVTDSLGCSATMTDGVSVNFSTIQNPNISQNHSSGQGRAVEIMNVNVNVNYTEGQISVNTQAAVNVTITAVNGAVIFSGMQYNNNQSYNVPANGVYLVSVVDVNGNKKVTTVTAL